MEELLAKLVAMPTLTDDIIANDMALDYIQDYLKQRGMHCQRHRFDGRGALTASTRATNRKTQTVLLAAHVDVMSADETMFKVREESGKLYGRGVFDMKFAIATYMQLVDDLAHMGTLTQYDFGILITTDEEFGKDSAAQLIRLGYRPKVCLLPDSTASGWNIEKIAKGWWRFDLIATGKAVHGSRPWEGESASFKLIHALHELKEHFKDHTPLTDSLNIGSIHGEGTYNLVPDRMMAKVEIRLVDEASYEKNKRIIETLCAEHDLSYNTFTLAQPTRPIIDHPLVDTFKDVVEHVTGKRPEDYISLGGSDAPYYTKAGIPCILTCPIAGRHHSSDEWVDKASFLQFLPILHEFLEKTAKSPAGSTTGLYSDAKTSNAA